jgi:hypothetical protein
LCEESWKARKPEKLESQERIVRNNANLNYKTKTGNLAKRSSTTTT